MKKFHAGRFMRIFSLLLVLLLLLPTVSLGATTATESPAVRINAQTAWDVHIQDTFSYPDTFQYNVGTDPDMIPDMFYNHPDYNLMLTFSASYLAYTWVGTRSGEYLLTLTPTYYDTHTQRAAVRDYVNRTADTLFHAAMTDRERLEAVNQYLVENFSYDESLSIYSVYPFLTQGTGVCQSYAQLGVMLLLAGGMDVYPISGRADGANHAWIAVKVDGYWYEFDPTYNDSIGYQDASTRVAYLMKTRADMQREGRTYDSFASHTYEWEDGLRQSNTTVSTEESQPSPAPALSDPEGSTLVFTDIQPGQWFYESALQVSGSGLMIGSGGLFLPNETVTLAQVLTVAARLHAQRSGTADVLEDLVAAGKAQKKIWYHPYVEYALSMGMIRGDEFGNAWVERNATREELAYLLQKSAGPLESTTSLFLPDIGDVQPLFVRSVRIMANAGIITGVDANNTFHPTGIATRAQLAVMLGRILQSNRLN